MPDVIDLVDPALLEQPPPRPLPLVLVPNLLGEYLLAQRLVSYFDPLVIGVLLAAIIFAFLPVPALIWAALALVLVLRMGTALWRVARRLQADTTLIRDGLVLWAYVLAVRPVQSAAGQAGGGFLDCAIPINRQKTLLGSVYVADDGLLQAWRQQNRLRVICLPRAPTTWRIIEANRQGLRYDLARDRRRSGGLEIW